MTGVVTPQDVIETQLQKEDGLVHFSRVRLGDVTLHYGEAAGPGMTFTLISLRRFSKKCKAF